MEENVVKIEVVNEVPETGDEDTIYIMSTNIVNEDNTLTPVIKGYVFQGGLCWDISPETEQEKVEFNKVLEEAGLQLRV